MCTGGLPDVSFVVLPIHKSDGWVDKLDCALQELGEVPERFTATAAEAPPMERVLQALEW